MHEELRVKETDRIRAVTETLTRLGANIEETKDGLIICGKTKLVGNRVESIMTIKWRCSQRSPR